MFPLRDDIPTERTAWLTIALIVANVVVFFLSLRVLENAKHYGEGEVRTKSGLMVGLGETHDELVDAFGMLREAGVQVLTVGQYLRPSLANLPMSRYYTPSEFAEIKRLGLELGFGHVESGPLVRSSYHAEQQVTGS